MLKTLIVDDEPDSIKSLSLICEEYCNGKVDVVGSAYIIEDAHNLIKEKNPDVLLLDIDLPRGNAFDLLDRCPNRNFYVILVSAYFDLYEKKMKKYNIHACVEKPVDIDEITSLMQMLYNQQQTS